MKAQINYLIHGREYAIDQKVQQFTPVGENAALVPFHALKNMNGYYSLDYDTVRGTGVSPSHSPTDPKSVRTVIIPAHFINSKSEAYTDDYAAAFNKKSYRYNWGIVIMDRSIRERLNDQLPKIEIAGADYEVRLAERRLKAMDTTQEDVPFRMMSMNEISGKTCMQFYFDTINYRPVERPAEPEKHPEIMLITIPPVQSLDPVFVAVVNNLHPTANLSYYPMVMHRVATMEAITNENNLNTRPKVQLPSAEEAPRKINDRTLNGQKKRGFGIDR